MPASNSPLIALVGVAVGFMLGEGSRYVRYRIEIWRNRRLIKTELSSVLAQLPQKRNILQQAIEHLKQERFMSTMSVRTVTLGYDSVQKALYPHLTPIERNCLHVIFERLRVADDQMDQLEDAFLRAMKDKIQANPFLVFIGRCEDLLRSYDVVADLATSYVSGKPIDVFGKH